ncbi:hypothetical protein JX265_003730 [Neoarthrinium moseri]|uniref:RlpA-like protein double-psi beta-barrel domain-containing protein n=1 Tax=Neoarthrinium moseri TaxID=1658444 RepID=A0A9P9WSD1_9PEZI|nr:uncharacterized protein JN550_002474 [Neoarthrinium moseri]KAI1853947.1 hypothetical protein JX266_001088 [Neoarthrinium moseri]KAI1875045.1 hypothetical protein JN550_002474 [Neoarthrinium moseri]KAI1877722.1 hypothetical protein JX265_003730 [Neoarthrinium moseri]
MKSFTVIVVAALVGFTNANHGRMTYYDPSVGAGACGTTHSDSEHVVALDATQFKAGGNPNNDPVCGKHIKISYNGKSTEALVVDKCPTCASQAIDVSSSTFKDIADLSVGVVQVDWDFV